MAETAIQYLTIHAAKQIDATVVCQAGPFTNAITIRRVRFGCNTPTGTSPTLALAVDDGGTNGAGTTDIITERAAAAVTVPGFTVEALNVNAADGYKLAAGNVITTTLTVGGTSPVFPGATVIVEYVDGIG